MIKLIVSDMDGTLLEKGKEFISDNINNIIKELKSKDIIFAIASGRHYNDLYRITKEMDGIYYICCDGGCIIYNNEVIYKKEINKSLIKKIKDVYYHTPFEIKKCYEEKDSIVKISTSNKGFTETPAGTYEIYRDKDWREWISFDCGKGQAVDFLQKENNIKVCETAVFGDNFNDTGMFRKAGKRYCIKNAPTQVKMMCNSFIDDIEKSLKEAGGI